MRDLPHIALTLIQPWGTLIIGYGKDLENRTWAPHSRLAPGDRLWVHAGMKWDHGSLDAGLALSRTFAAQYVEHEIERVHGALLGHVRFDGVVRESSSPWWVGPVGWRLSDPIALAAPIPCRGAQGLWAVPSDVLERAAQEVARG